MRSSLLLLLLSCSFILKTQAQQTDTSFLNEWFSIDTLILERGLPKTALEKVNALYTKAVQQQLPAQQIKCLIYRYSLENSATEKTTKDAVAALTKEIETAKDPVAKAVLQLLLAKKTASYFSQKRYQILDRTPVENDQQLTIDTWSLDNFYQFISKLYFTVLEQDALLKRVSISSYDAVLKRGTKRFPNTSIYDLAINESMEFFKLSDLYQINPVNRFTLKDVKALAILPEFIQHSFTTTDSSSGVWITLRLYQQILKHHIQDADKSLLIFLDLQRLNWVSLNSQIDKQEILREKNYRWLAEQYPANNATAEIWSQVAQIHINKAYNYSASGDTTNRFEYIRAKQIIASVIHQYNDSVYGVKLMNNQLAQIQQVQMSLTAEQVNSVQLPFRAKLDYRNMDSVYIRILRIDDTFNNMDRVWENGFWKKIVKHKIFKTLSFALPKTNDHQLHSTEIALPGLAAGNYAILCSNDPFFNDSLSKLRYLPVMVSNISYIKNGSDFFVVHRETGKPLANVNVTVQQQFYDGVKRRYDFKTALKIVTDKNGHFSFVEKYNSGYFRYHFETKNDQLKFNSGEYEYFTSASNDDVVIDPNTEEMIRFEKDARRIFFFTDRSIYRPGQTVYFKGIGVTKSYETRNSKVLTKDSGWVILRDVNRKKLDSIRFVLNEYGSFSGSFKLPAKTLTGSFGLYTTGIPNGYTYFSVEEYKRPTYSVNFEKVKGSYRLNDSITLTGNAKAFAGNNIDGAKVRYSITRFTRRFYPWYRRGPSRGDDKREIANGTLTTDASGNFKVHFKANADDINEDENTNTQFTFSVSATVTDGNGETRTANTDITMGYQSLQLDINSPRLADSKDLKQIGIKTTNLSGEADPANVQVLIFSLKTPERLVRKRLWEKPDQFLMTEQEFLRLFPHDEYAAETEITTWPIASLVSEESINTGNSAGLMLKQALPAGEYKIEASTKGKDGKTVKAVQYMSIMNLASNQIPHLSYQLIHLEKTNAIPGDTAAYTVGTSANEVYVIQKTERKNQPVLIRYQNRKAGYANNQFIPVEKDRGGFAVAEAYVLHNRVYITQTNIEVPWTNKSLEVQYSSFRNKTEPGSEETWTVEVKGSDNNKVAAELLTTMYDASLDQFKPHQLTSPGIWQNNYFNNTFSSGRNFIKVGASENYTPTWNYLPPSYTTIDRLAEHYNDFLEENIRNWITLRKPVISDKLVKYVDQMLTARYSYNMASSKAVAGSTAAASFRNDTNAPPPAPLYETVLASRASGVQIRGISSLANTNDSKVLYVVNGKPVTGIPQISPEKILQTSTLSPEAATALYGPAGANGAIVITTADELAPITIRKNFNETAFFFPHLYADTSGNYKFSFTMPDALTKWKWMSLAHTKELAFGTTNSYVTSQKTVMIQANAPRFVREGDQLEFSAKLSNLSEKELSGQATLELIDAATGNPVDGWFQNVFPVQYFTAGAGQSTTIKFPFQVPFSFNKTLSWRITARAENYSDGEENMLPVLTNRQLVTESLPILITKDTTQSFYFEKLAKANSPSLTHEAIAIQYTSNPIWEAIRALPYLMEYPYECVEQTFNRFYANTLGNYIVNRDPKIKKVFEAWRKDTATAKSKLQLNESLKQIMLEETPWVFAAQSETEQQQNIARLFDVFRLNEQTSQLIKKLQDMQSTDGSFSWFKGGSGDRYMTNYVVTGLGKLKRIGALTPDIAIQLKPIIEKAVKFLDATINTDYQYWKKSKLDTTQTLISNLHIQYLYMRSFFRDIAPPKNNEAYQFFYDRGKFQIQRQSIYNRALLGLVYYRNNEIRYVNVNIRNAILENAVQEKGKASLYWKERHTYSWYQTPIEHQATMIQFLQELQQGQPMSDGNKSIDQARNWLLLNKQTNHWNTTIATAEACYALLMTGSDLLYADKYVNIQLGNTSYSNQNKTTEAGTGYFEQRIEGRLVKPEMGNIKVTVQTKGNTQAQGPSWGSVYWQYFEDMDKITRSATPLSITKQLFVERNSDKGKTLDPVKENDALKPGDKVVIRLILKTDRDMEYLHLKDTRAASMEPVNVLSGYKWQGGLGYYESTKDASTNFFISNLYKGTYVFDYPVFITHTGIFTTGNASIQCMYAPEFTANSGGMKIRVEE